MRAAMQAAHSVRTRWQVPNRRDAQRGQALVYGLFLITAGLAALALMFNAGQLTAEKTKLVNTADAVAYSGGVMHARALNFTAYTNRALVANEVLIAQSISLQSWARFIQTRTVSLQRFMECHASTGGAGMAHQLVSYGVDYAALCRALVLPSVAGAVNTSAQALELGAAASVAALELNKASIQLSQGLVHAPLVFRAMRDQTLQDVADANYRGDGLVRVEPNITSVGGLLTLTDGWGNFTRRYSGDERTRMADVVRAAAGSDGFVQSRQWDSRAPLMNPWCILAGEDPIHGPRDRVTRRGGTELVDFDEWRAEDTESWRSHEMRGILRGCRERERESIGFGSAEHSPTDMDPDHTRGRYGDAAVNELSHGDMNTRYTTRNSMYSGIPGYHDLSPEFLDQADGNPMLTLSIRVIRPRDQLRTSDGRSQIRGGERINAYRSEVAADEMAAVSASQVYFARPSEHTLNAFGQRLFGNTRANEIGSLFNPYWQVRLADARADVDLQRVRQAAGD
jgi:hypothetical protein